MMKIAYPVRLPDTSTETVSPELRRCLRRILSPARHSRNTALAWSGTRLDRRSPPASGGLQLMRFKTQLPTKNENKKYNNSTLVHGHFRRRLDVNHFGHPPCATAPPSGADTRCGRPAGSECATQLRHGATARSFCDSIPVHHGRERLYRR